MEKSLELKSISKILGMNFFIPSYQRGYRWGDRQVLDLLKDIYEFANKTKIKDEFYCLQPIVVAIKKDDKYNIIDGQQRLTTIYIILKYLKDSGEKFKEFKDKEEYKEILEFCDIEGFGKIELYTIEYETREDSKKFLENTIPL